VDIAAWIYSLAIGLRFCTMVEETRRWVMWISATLLSSVRARRMMSVRNFTILPQTSPRNATVSAWTSRRYGD